MVGRNSSSTSISVSWDEVQLNQQNGIITGYTVIYQSQTENHNGNVSAGANNRQKNLTGLKEYVNYNITLFASTVKGDGPHSSPVLVVRTDLDSKYFILPQWSNCDRRCLLKVVEFNWVQFTSLTASFMWFSSRFQL